MGLRGLRPVSATRPWPHLRRCSFGITACRLAVTGQVTALAVNASMRTFWKQKSPIDLDQADVHAATIRNRPIDVDSRCDPVAKISLPALSCAHAGYNSARRAGHPRSNAG